MRQVCSRISFNTLWSLYAVCLANSSCSSFHSLDLWSYGGAFGDLSFLLPVWITFRDCNFLFSDGSFRLSAWMSFMGIVNCPNCFKFPQPFKWAFLDVSSCKSFPEVILGQWFAIFTAATFTFSLSDLFGLLHLFVEEWMDNPFPSHSCLSSRIYNAGDANNHTLDHDYNFLFCNWNTEDDLLFQMDFSQSFGYTVFLRKCLVQLVVLVEFRCPPHSWSGHVQKNIFRISSISLLTSQRLHCRCSVSRALFLRTQHVLLLLLEDVTRYIP